MTPTFDIQVLTDVLAQAKRDLPCAIQEMDEMAKRLQNMRKKVALIRSNIKDLTDGIATLES